jgi:hypothetical protein
MEPRDILGIIADSNQDLDDDDDDELQEAQRALEESLNAVSASGRRVAELRKAWVESVAEQGGQRLSDIVQLMEDLPGRWQHMCADEREQLLKVLAGQLDEESSRLEDGVARAG